MKKIMYPGQDNVSYREKINFLIKFSSFLLNY